MHFCMAYQFNATQLVLKDYQLSIYLNGPVIGSPEILGTVIALSIVDRLPRKPSIIIGEALSIGVAVALTVWASCEG